LSSNIGGAIAFDGFSTDGVLLARCTGAHPEW
jgi:hypothetical protein